MADKAGLAKYLTRTAFTKIEHTFHKHFNLGLETTDINGNEVAQMCSEDCFPQFCRLVRSSPSGNTRCHQDRLRSLNVAMETGQPYICLCHAGIVLVCIPIMNGEMPLGGFFFGKCLWEPPSEVVIDDIYKRLKGVKINKAKLEEAIDKLPIVSGRKIHEASEFLFILLYEICRLDPQVIKWRRERTIQQSHIGEFIHERKRLSGEWEYPLESERELIGKVRIGDRTGAKEILNSILGTVLLQSPGDLDILKARLLELLSMLSRSAVEGGVDINVMLKKNLDYINKVTQINNQPDLSAWVGSALDDFIELVYTSQGAKRVTQLKPATDFIHANFDQQLSLTDVAKKAHLSVSRLSHVFKEQMGTTVIDYLTLVRIERAKELLVSTNKSCTEVCFEVGYNNQSYFTRKFNKIAGMTPRKFRKLNRRTN